jgi:hypothetical protein
MDPFAALGVAGNIIQFVDFAFKLISESREIHHATDGMGADVRLLDLIIIDVVHHNQRIASSNSQDSALQRLIQECHILGGELLDGLNKLKGCEGQSKWASLVIALKRVWKQNKIDSLSDRIAKVQARIAHHVQYKILLVKLP